MDEGIFILLFVVLVLFGIGFVIVQHYAEKERREKLWAVAMDLGLSFSDEGEPHLRLPRDSFHLFSQGRSRKAYHFMDGSVDGVDVTLFDYRYTTSSGRHSQTHRQTVLLLESERLQLPLFRLRPEHLFHKIAGTLGYQDIDFPLYPTFSDRYLLRGPDEDGIRATFRGEVLDRYPGYGDLCSEGAGRQLICYRANRRVEPAAVAGFVQEGLALLDLLAARPPAEPRLAPQVEAEPEAEAWTEDLDRLLDDLAGTYGADEA
jgi:hypothetical protein